MTEDHAPRTSRTLKTSGDRVAPPEDWEKVDSGGPAGFEDTRAVYRLPDGSEYVWDSRRHRKGRGAKRATGRATNLRDSSPKSQKKNPWLGGFAPHRMSWWVAVIFTVGSALFTLAATASLFPAVFGSEASSTVAPVSYFVGALLFTVGIYLQVLEAINSRDYIGFEPPYKPSQSFRWIAWQPRRLAFMAPALLLVGSLSFNVETTSAVAALIGLFTLPGVISTASLIGSMLFLVTSYMQMIEVCHRYFCWRPREISWWVTVLFVLGSVGFVVGAASGMDVLGLSYPEDPGITKVGYMQGSVFFLVGSYLLLPEMFSE